MKKALVCSLAVASLLVLGGPAIAEICAIDTVPAATLLLPYFETDLNGTGIDGGTDTLFSINNASAAPVLAHVVVWTDLSVPALDFDVYLTGYDVVTMSMFDLIVNGNIPQTGPGISDGKPANHGTKSLADVNFPGCAFPINDLDSARQNHLQAFLTGNDSPLPGFACGGLNYGDGVARGYVTVDVVQQCSLQFPGDPGYFTNTIDFDNVLWGDWFFVDGGNDFAQGEPLVHIEACDPLTTTLGDPSVGEGENCDFAPGDYTFYGRYNGFTATDQREPLAQTWRTRYFTSETQFDGGTDLVIWRDAKVAEDQFGFACGGAPSWFPLSQGDVMCWDEMEIAEDNCFTTSDVSPNIGGADTCFPAEAARYNIEDSVVPGSQSVDPSFPAGFCMIDLGFTLAGADPFPGVAQSYMVTTLSALGRFSVGYQATQLDELCTVVAQ